MHDFRHKIHTKQHKIIQAYLRRNPWQSSQGFTLLEAIVVVALFGILAAIAAPAWQAQLNTQRLNAARSQAVTALSEGKTRAKQQNIPYEVGFRQQGQQAQWAVYPTNANPLVQPWQNLPDGVRLLGSPDTTLLQRDNSIYRIQFNHRGGVDGQLGRVTFSTPSGGGTKRCAIVSNLLGTVREGENRPTRQNNPCD
ncbi:prepilin-type N-terminal cleavage/methylation domain-containing protein [Leptolyngbya sp. DQ-M1]|uniref:pilus assembly FimT family protein n=1 Tax=Leptolyngbya sp. DQ-M1 TaxID=2933920 RepID=UPI0032968532